MVLIVMLVVLIQRVFELFKEPEARVEKRIERPGPPPEELQPPAVPPAPRIDTKGAYSQLDRRNPFTMTGGAAGAATEVTAESLGLKLRRIQPTNGVLRAQIDTESAKRQWYSEGDTFEAYVLQSIDPEAKTVVVYATEYERAFTLTQ